MDYKFEYMNNTVAGGKDLHSLAHWLIKDPSQARVLMPNIIDNRHCVLIEATKLESHYQLSMKQFSDYGAPIPVPSGVSPSEHIGIHAHGIYIAVNPNIISYLVMTLATASIGSSITLGIHPVVSRGFNVPDGYSKLVIEVFPLQGWSGEPIN